MSIPPTRYDEYDPGTEGDEAAVRDEMPLEDVLWAHRHAVHIVSRTELTHRLMRDYTGKPINEIPWDLMRQWMRNMEVDNPNIHSVVLLPSVPGMRRWY